MVHFVRHGEGFHNIGIVNEDAHLTEAGWRQAEALNKHIQQLKPAIDVQVYRTVAPYDAPQKARLFFANFHVYRRY